MADLAYALILLGAVQGLALGIALWKRPEDPLANRLLGTLVLALTTMLGLGYAELRFAQENPHLLALAAPLPFLFSPLLFLYVQTLSGTLTHLRLRHLAHAFPFLLDLAYMAHAFYFRDGEQKRVLLSQVLTGHAPLALSLLDVVQLAQAVAYLGSALVHLRRHSERVERYFSTISSVDLRWLYRMLWAHAAVWSLVAVGFGLRLGGHSIPPVLRHGVPAASALVLFLIGYMALAQSEVEAKARAASLFADDESYEPTTTQPALRDDKVATPLQDATMSGPTLAHGGTPSAPQPSPHGSGVARLESRYQRNRLTQAEVVELQSGLERAMAHEHLYRDPDLTLPELAAHLGAPPHSVSQVLNVHVGKTFHAFVNDHRVAALKQLLTSEPESGVLSLALRCGFNSKSTVNSYFKRSQGQTPTEFRRAQRVRTLANDKVS